MDGAWIPNRAPESVCLCQEDRSFSPARRGGAEVGKFRKTPLCGVLRSSDARSWIMLPNAPVPNAPNAHLPDRLVRYHAPLYEDSRFCRRKVAPWRMERTVRPRVWIF